VNPTVCDRFRLKHWSSLFVLSRINCPGRISVAQKAIVARRGRCAASISKHLSLYLLLHSISYGRISRISCKSDARCCWSKCLRLLQCCLYPPSSHRLLVGTYMLETVSFTFAQANSVKRFERPRVLAIAPARNSLTNYYRFVSSCRESLPRANSRRREDVCR